MQGVGSIINRETVLFSIQCEFASSNAVAISTDQTTKKRIICKIIIQAIVAEYDVPHRTMPIGRFEWNYDPPVGTNTSFQSLAVAQGENVHGRAILQSAQGVHDQLCLRHIDCHGLFNLGRRHPRGAY